MKDIFETMKTEPGRHWTDNMCSWVQEEEIKGRDGYTSVASRDMGRTIFEEEEVSWGQGVEKYKLEEVKLEFAGEEEDTTSLSLLDSNDEPSSWRLQSK